MYKVPGLEKKESMLFIVNVYVSEKIIAYKTEGEGYTIWNVQGVFFPAEPCRAVQVEPLLGAAEQTGTALLRVSALTTTHKPRAVLFIFLSFNGAKR